MCHILGIKVLIFYFNDELSEHKHITQITFNNYKMI